MYARKNRRKRSFKRVVVTLLTFVMLLSVCFPGMMASADEVDPVPTESQPAEVSVYETLLKKIEEAKANTALTADDLDLLGQEISTAYEAEEIDDAQYVALTNAYNELVVAPADNEGDEDDYSESSEESSSESVDESSSETTEAPSETTTAPTDPSESEETTAPSESEETTEPSESSEATEAAQDPAVTALYNQMMSFTDAESYWAFVNSMTNEQNVLYEQFTEDQFNALFAHVDELTADSYSDFENYTGSVSVEPGNSTTYQLDGTSNRSNISIVNISPESYDYVSITQNGRTLSISVDDNATAGQTFTFTIIYTVRNGGGGSSTEHSLNLTVTVADERQIVLDKFDSTTYPVYLAVRQDGNIPGEPSVQGSSGYNFYNSSYNVGGVNTFATYGEGIIDTSIVDYQNFFYTSVDGSQTVGLVDSTGTTIKAALTGINWDTFIEAIAEDGNVTATDGVRLTESNMDNYTVVPYVIKLQETDGIGWHIDCAIVPKTAVTLSYDINIPDGLVIVTNNVGVPNSETGTPPATFSVGELNGLTTIDGQTDAIQVKSADGTEQYVFMFQGWNTKADGSGTWYQPNSEITINENTVLYAIWNSNPALGTGNLEIEKIVNTDAVDADASFTFRVYINNADGTASNVSYDYVIYNANTIAQSRGKISNGGTISLKHTQYVEIQDLPAVNDDDGQPNVTVTEINYEGYDPSWDGGTTVSDTISVTIQGGRDSRVTCTNSVAAPKTSSLTINKTFKFNGNDTDYTLPKDVTVNVGETNYTLVPTETDHFTYTCTITGLTIGQNINASEVIPTITNWNHVANESTISGSDTIESNAENNVINLTNVYERDTETVAISKTFEGLDIADDKWPTSITVNVKDAAGTTDVATVNLTDDDRDHTYTGTSDALKVGVEYTFEEVAPTFDYFQLASTTVTSQKLTIAASNNTLTFNNIYTRKTADITITKTVTGNMGDINKSFSFSATITGANVADAEMEATATSVAYTIANNVVTFQLKHDEKVEIKGLPQGVKLVITETNEGYAASSKSGNDTGDATFTIEAINGNQTVNYTNNKTADVDTGVTLDTFPMILLFSTVTVLGAVLLIGKKRYQF